MTFWAMAYLTTGEARRVAGSAAGQWWPLEAVDPGEVLDRTPPQPTGCRHRAAQHDERRNGTGLGDLEQGPDVILPAYGNGGHDAGQSLGPGRQQEAPDEGVNGGAPGEGVAGEVTVHRGQSREVGQDEEEGGSGIERLGEPGWAGGRRLGVGRLLSQRRRLGLPVGERGPGDEAGAGQRQVFVPVGQAGGALLASPVRVLDHDGPIARAVAAAGGETGRIE